MDSPFVFNKFVTGTDFIARTGEQNLLFNMLKQRQHCLIYEPAKSGKRSLIQQTILRMQKEAGNFTLCNINLFNVRTRRAFVKKFTNHLFSLFATTVTEWESLASELLAGTPYKVEAPEYSTKSISVDFGPVLSKEHICSILKLAEKLSEKYSTNIIVYLEEFQEINLHEDADDTFKLMEKCWMDSRHCTFLITGSFVNEMKEIFEEKRFFYRFAERIKLEPIDEKSFSEYIIRNFLKAGRVVTKELAVYMYKLTEGHPWYTQQLADISYGLTRGYLTEQIINQSFTALMELHNHRFHAMTSRMSLFQLNFIKAILDEMEKFSSTEVLSKYELQSSANVNRIKEALQKKEIIQFEKGKPYFIDPLFKTWLKQIYFS